MSAQHNCHGVRARACVRERACVRACVLVALGQARACHAHPRACRHAIGGLVVLYLRQDTYV
jgi:hypothetical protein